MKQSQYKHQHTRTSLFKRPNTAYKSSFTWVCIIYNKNTIFTVHACTLALKRCRSVNRKPTSQSKVSAYLHAEYTSYPNSTPNPFQTQRRDLLIIAVLQPHAEGSQQRGPGQLGEKHTHTQCTAAQAMLFWHSQLYAQYLRFWNPFPALY